jgi:hypothetical protein
MKSFRSVCYARSQHFFPHRESASDGRNGERVERAIVSEAAEKNEPTALMRRPTGIPIE